MLACTSSLGVVQSAAKSVNLVDGSMWITACKTLSVGWTCGCDTKSITALVHNRTIWRLEDVSEGVPIKPATIPTVCLGFSVLDEPLLLVAINDILASVQVCLMRLDAFGLVHQLVAGDHDEIERNAEIARLDHGCQPK